MAVRVDDRNVVEENVKENVALEVDAEAVGERGAVPVGLEVVDGDTVAEPADDTVNVHPSARSEMFNAHG